MAEEPGNSSSEKTLKIHDFLKFEIQGIAVDEKKPLNYQIVANEGFLYLHEPKLVCDNENQITMDPMFTNKSPFPFMSDANSHNKTDNSTQHADIKHTPCLVKCSLQKIESDKCLQQNNSLDRANTKKKGCTKSKMVMTEEHREFNIQQKFRKPTNQKKHPVKKPVNQISAKTSTSVTSLDLDDSDREKRLYFLLKRLMAARQKEKQRYQWDCYITELRHKYNTMDNEQSSYALRDRNKLYPLAVTKEYSSKDCFSPTQSIYSKDYFQDKIYLKNDTYCTNIPIDVQEDNVLNKNNYFCYHTCSQGRFMYLQKGKKNRKKEAIRSDQINKFFNKVFVEQQDKASQTFDSQCQLKREIRKHLRSPKYIYSCSNLQNLDFNPKSALHCNEHKPTDSLQSKTCACKNYCSESRYSISKVKTNVCTNTQTGAQQTTCKCKQERNCNAHTISGISYERLNNGSKTFFDPNMCKIKENNNALLNSSKLHERYTYINKAYHQYIDERECDSGNNNSVPQHNCNTEKPLEIKIDNLINTINNLIDEAKLHQCTHKKSLRSVAINYSTATCKVNKVMNNISSNAKDLVKSFVQQEAFTTTGTMCTESSEEILLEEINKSNKAKQDIENIINGHPTISDNTNFEAPTKERSTEVTASLSKQQIKHNVLNSSITTKDEGQTTAAVNTEPLGFLALMQVSTGTIKQLLSYVPTLTNVPQMIPLSQGCQQHHRSYICSICGAGFERSSQLTDHIKIHNLGKARNCCVCRHVLDSGSKNVSEFSCQYCGQKFARAYCCELHQASCARRCGRPPEHRPSLVELL